MRPTHSTYIQYVVQPVRKLLVSYGVVAIIKDIVQPTAEKTLKQETPVAAVKSEKVAAVADVTTPVAAGDYAVYFSVVIG